MNRLWVRMLLASIAAVAIAVGTVAFTANYATIGGFRAYLEQVDQQRNERIREIFGKYYADNGAWEGVDALLSRIARLVGEQLVLVDDTGIVVADSAGRLNGRRADRNWPRAIATIVVGDARVSTVYLNPTLPSRTASVRERAFLSQTNQSLVWASALAVTSALALSLALSRTILGPISAVIRAARRMAEGDLSQRVLTRASGEVGELAQAFNDMGEHLAKAQQQRKQMVADIAHELRTPLSNINGYLDAIRDGVLEASPETIEVLYEEATSLRRLVNDLQDLAMAEAGQISLEWAPLSLNDAAAQVTAAMQPMAEARGVILTNQLPERLPLVVADYDRVCQVLRNLISNALTHTPSGGRVELTAQVEDHRVRLAVTDSGSGISPADLPHVFERFYRADRARARATGGAGLGLTITRELVRALGGTIEARSHPGRGSEFVFTLPLAA